MSSIHRLGSDVAFYAKVWLPLALYLALWFSIAPGRVQNLAHPESPIEFVHGIRATLPFIAGVIGGILILVTARRYRPDFSFFIGPLGFIFVYAVVGIIATLLSTDKSESIYWAGSYISVPLALWAIGYGPDTLQKVHRVFDMTWLLMIVTLILLLAYAFIKLDLFNAILHPTILERCQFGPAWFEETGGALRSTGVGRYAAVAALVAIAGIAYGKWRLIWGVALFAALLLLFSSGARTAFMGFTGASAIMVFLYWGRKAAVVTALIAVVAVPALLATGAHDTLVLDCLSRSYQAIAPSQPIDGLNQYVPTPDALSQPLVDGPSTGSSAGGTSFEETPGEDAGTFPSDNGAQPSPNTGTSPAVVESLALVNFSGRPEIWRAGLTLIKQSPILGHGFNADRIQLNTQMHNSFLHSLVQTGALGTIPLVVGILIAWALLFKSARNLLGYSNPHRTRIVLAGGILAFFSIRSIAESSGAFFGIDLLLLAPVLLYLSVVNQSNDARV